VGEGTLALKGPTKTYELRGNGQPVPVDSNVVVSLVVVADRPLFHPEAEVKNEECGQAVGRAFRGLGGILPQMTARATRTTVVYSIDVHRQVAPTLAADAITQAKRTAERPTTLSTTARV
jgi:phosphodiesterase/alkaline phosphatase D-like protein